MCIRRLLSARWKSLWLRIHKIHAHHWAIHYKFIIQIWEIHLKFVAIKLPASVYTPSRRWVQVLPSLHRPKRQGNTTLNNIAISVMVSEGVNVICYSFADETCEIVKFLLIRIKVMLSSKSKKDNINVPGNFLECTVTTHSSCFMSFRYQSVQIQVSTVMEVNKETSKSMNMLSGNSSEKSNLVNLLLDNPHIIYSTTDEKVIHMLSIQHQPCKGCGKKSSVKRMLGLYNILDWYGRYIPTCTYIQKIYSSWSEN